MIQSKQDYKEYIEYDREANKISGIASKMRITWKYLKKLRRYEYALNCLSQNNIFFRIYTYWCRYNFHNTSVKSGIQIPPNVFGKGLYIPHYGTIVVNSTSKFGDYCVIQAGVNISQNAKGGHHIYFGAGSKIMPNVNIASDVIIGANAVVTKNVDEENIVMGGVPAKKISSNGFRSNRKVI